MTEPIRPIVLTGDIEKTRRRFMSHAMPETNGCWRWTACADQKGYGAIRLNGCSLGAHRVAWVLFRGQIPDGLTIDHLCRNHWCLNPEHLEPVTNRVNILRGNGMGAQYARATCCKRGHKKTPENTYTAPRGTRECRVCKLMAYIRRRQREGKACYRVISAIEYNTNW